MSSLRTSAPAKINLGLFVGPLRLHDRRHEIASVMQSISLADELVLEPLADAGCDEVLCHGVEGPPAENLAMRALRAFRDATGWDGPRLRLRLDKRIPVSAGLGGGSADAAAALRLAAQASGRGDRALLLRLAAELGADVPAQLAPGRWLASGAGEQLRELRAPRTPLGVLVLPLLEQLSTAAVYEQFDGLAAARSAQELRALYEQLAAALARGQQLPPRQLLHNDLQDAARSLCPAIADTLAEALGAGAPLALLSGSGPTVLGLFPGTDGVVAAARAAAALEGRTPAAISASSVHAPWPAA